MRLFINLLILFIVLSCNETPNLTMEIKTIKTNLTAKNNEYLKFYHPEKIGQEMQIQFIKKKENSKYYGIMSCSYDLNFILDNKDFTFQIINCDSNYPSYIKFHNNKSNQYKLLVTKNPNSKNNYFRIGYKKIIVPKDFHLIDVYNKQFESKKYEILWSEPIKFE